MLRLVWYTMLLVLASLTASLQWSTSGYTQQKAAGGPPVTHRRQSEGGICHRCTIGDPPLANNVASGPPAISWTSAHQRMPLVASGGPPHGCPADSGLPTSFIVCRWWTTGGPSVAIATFRLLPACRWWSTSSFLPFIATGGSL